MYETDFIVKMCEIDSNNKRRRSHTAKLMMSVMMSSWQPGSGQLIASPQRAGHLRRFCLATTALAFLLGILVGVAIPLYIVPHSPLAPTPQHHIGVTFTNRTARVPEQRVVYENPRIDFDSVSFVVKPEMPMMLRQKLYGEKEAARSVRRANTDGVYWTKEVENYLPKGFLVNDTSVWRKFSRKTPVVKVEEGCGRMQNRLLTYEDGTKSCCRYRQNTDQIQGELFSFYLGTLLKLRNLAPSSLALVKLDTPLFSKVKPQLNLAQWSEDRAVVLTRFVDKLVPANIPTELRTSSRRLHPVDVENASREDLVELMQWSDLIVFDYLTANLDRVVNNIYNLQWNAAMMDSPAHNLAKDPDTGLLVFFDNESGLLHGYRLLEKYEHYHIALLEALCVFRKSTADVIKALHERKDVGELLFKLFRDNDKDFKEVLPSLPEKSVKILNERIDRVYDQITMCERQYPRLG